MGNGLSLNERVERAKKTGILTLSETNLRQLPPEVLAVTSLKSFNLPDLSRWAALKILDLSHNQLRSVPPSVATLARLEILGLDHNLLAEISDQLLAGLAALKTLELAHNQITVLPVALGSLTSLVTLDISHNRLTTLPDGFGPALPHLEHLDASHNALAAVPASLAAAPRLRSLALAHNAITDFPEQILGESVVASITLEGNPVTLEDLRDLPGYKEVMSGVGSGREEGRAGSYIANVDVSSLRNGGAGGSWPEVDLLTQLE